ncbi:MAG TPA: MmgE/PrpD family protein [Lichenihabitans sp.]|jgi:2-methylcitrate dehydratase PrpD|nr:MmgE/PrpD family protein [Lichenihabitans sp.]
MSTEHTMRRLLDLAAVQPEAVPRGALTLAGFSLFDWLVVARAGCNEPLSRIVRDFVCDEGGRPVATLAGSGSKAPARAAALVNGTISHALDYDDTHFAHVGHLSVGILPAALAVAEQVNAPAVAVRDAFVIGAEAACRVGMVLGRGHYERGFHQTATAGAFGAAIAAGRLLGLTEARMRNALSLVATRASGLKSQFGTMGKPFNAGIAAANGVEAASLAQRGFVSCDDGIGGPQGFIDTHALEASEAAAWTDPPPATFIFEDNRYKLHACCHGLHAMIDALLEVRRNRDLEPDRVARILVRTNPRWLRVCDIKRPRTGLEAKFSYGMLAAMVLHGISTAADGSYTDALGADPALLAVAQRVDVAGDPCVSDTAAEVLITLESGERIETGHDLAAPLSASALELGLRDKARALLGEATAERLWSGVATLERRSARDLAALLNA